MRVLTKFRLHILLTVLAVLAGVAVFLAGTKGDKPVGKNITHGLVGTFSFNRDIQNDFSAHKALYEIKLASTRSGSQILNIGGQMYYEWKPSCEAWLSDHRFNMHYEYADAPSMQLASNFSTYESFDGKRFEFTSQRKSNGEVFEEIRGSVIDGQAVYRLPEEQVIDLPGGTLFPVAHTIEVAKQIKKSKTFYNAVIFDGSDLEGPVEVNSFLGEVTEPPSSLIKQDSIDGELLKSPARKIRLAFFPMKDDQITADYEMDLVFHENGVISDMVVEYDDFSVTQKLVALEKLEGECAAFKEGR